MPPWRTVKPCGPDTPTLVSSSREENFSLMTVARKPGHRGELGISRKPPRREGRIASAEPVCSCAFLFVHFCTRDRGCSAHPVFPAPSCYRGRQTDAKLGRIAPRDRGRTSSRCLTIESKTTPSPSRQLGQVRKQNGSSFRGDAKHRARNPYSGSWLWIPGLRLRRIPE
jgi:hypothetical protein